MKFTYWKVGPLKAGRRGADGMRLRGGKGKEKRKKRHKAKKDVSCDYGLTVE
jgi:hypothetical protein